jgi:hypothetical protein
MKHDEHSFSKQKAPRKLTPQPHVLDSLKHSRTWYHFQVEFLVPVLFSRSRSMAIARSLPCRKNLAVAGWLGNNHQMTGTQATPRHPCETKVRVSVDWNERVPVSAYKADEDGLVGVDGA